MSSPRGKNAIVGTLGDCAFKAGGAQRRRTSLSRSPVGTRGPRGFSPAGSASPWSATGRTPSSTQRARRGTILKELQAMDLIYVRLSPRVRRYPADEEAATTLIAHPLASRNGANAYRQRPYTHKVEIDTCLFGLRAPRPTRCQRPRWVPRVVANMTLCSMESI